jgi:hypothetical protein
MDQFMAFCTDARSMGWLKRNAIVNIFDAPGVDSDGSSR